ncbi:MAG TPA: triose-phosphate isomerase [Xanthobacteraceae bacterium]|nr:triose-phosphate isomerase [Xanthobacteraceae bacterium]
MNRTRRPLVAGNWKMNGLTASLSELDAICRGYSQALAAKTELLICPPFPLLFEAVRRAGNSGVAIGAQDCHPKAYGAHTGDVSAEMLKDAGARYVILGHSERRADHGETDAVVRAKTEGAWRAGLSAIVCVGESRAQREAGEAIPVVSAQLAGSIPDGANGTRLVVAYEPVWAIGTGLTPTPQDVAEVHTAIRKVLEDRFSGEAGNIRILYGGGGTPKKTKNPLFQDNVDGALVGGASLKSSDLHGISGAYI